VSPVTRLRRRLRRGWHRLRDDLRRRADGPAADTAVTYPEYDAYERRPRRLRVRLVAGSLVAVVVAGTWFAVAGGLGGLLSDPSTGPQPAGGHGTPTGHPSPSPSPGLVIGAPTPVSSPGGHRTRTPTAPTAPTARPTSNPPSAGHSPTPTARPSSPSASPTSSPTPSATGTPTPTPSVSDTPTPTPTGSASGANPLTVAHPAPARSTVAPPAA
jgi:hypothetical protein